MPSLGQIVLASVTQALAKTLAPTGKPLCNPKFPHEKLTILDPNDPHLFLTSPRNGTANHRWFFPRLVER